MGIIRNFLVLLFLAMLASNVNAENIANTTASSLNVRASPNGDVLFAIPKNSVVGVIKVQGKWAMIMYMPDNNPQAAKHGWVSTSYLQVIHSMFAGGSIS